jgi:hypothetical protein
VGAAVVWWVLVALVGSWLVCASGSAGWVRAEQLNAQAAQVAQTSAVARLLSPEQLPACTLFETQPFI